MHRAGTSRVATFMVSVAVLAACSGAQDASQSKPSTGADNSVVTIDVGRLRHGRPPRLAWFSDSTLHQGRRTTRLTGEAPAEVAVTPTRIVTSSSPTEPDTVVQVRSLDGKVTSEYRNPSGSLVTNAQHNLVGWTTYEGKPQVLQDGRPEAIELPGADRGDAAMAVAILGHDCANGPETVEGAGCSMFFSISRDKQIVPLVSSNHGFVEKASDRIADLQDVSSQQAMIGLIVAGGDRLCSRYESESKSYRTCAYMPRTFSAKGDRLIAYPSKVSEGPAVNEISVRDVQTGKALITARSPKDSATIWDAKWEDRSHVLAVVNQDERFFIVRIGLDGTAERAVGPVASTSANFAFVTQP